jgi:hypothetical protein
MLMTDKELRRRFVMAVDEVIPPSPALEARVSADLHLEHRPGQRTLPARSISGRGSALRLAAGLAAILIALTVVTGLLFGIRLLQPVATSHQPTPQTSPLSSYKFTPSATTRLASWPVGDAVPVELAGCWQSLSHPNDPAFELCLGQYSFDVGQGFSVGNVVVNGSQVDFFSNLCGSNVGMPYDGYRFTISGDRLALTSLAKLTPRGTGSVDSWSSCGWELDGSYSRLASP